MPRLMCGTWPPFWFRVHFICDLLIAAAYFAIPFAILVSLRRGIGLRAAPAWLTVSFAVFILACGATHAVEACMFWTPYYVLSGYLKMLTAASSWVTLYALCFTVPGKNSNAGRQV